MIFLRGVIAGAAGLGVDADALLAVAGLSVDDLQDPDAWISRHTLAAVFEEGVRQSGDEAFGLHLAEQTAVLGTHHALGYVFRSSATLREALDRVARYFCLLHKGIDLRLEVEGEHARLSLRLRPGLLPLPSHIAEALLAMLFLRGREAIGPALSLRAVQFVHSAPASTAEHERIFQAPAYFGQAWNGLAFDTALLASPMRSVDKTLHQIVVRYLEAMLARAPATSGILARVRQQIAAQLPGECPSLEASAARLRMTPRTLQRRLKEEGTSFQELVTQMRRELALRYLGESDTAICEVAFLLGFSEVSNFYRAFRRWTGETPAEFRERQRAQTASL